jgi:hypothetical protein
MNAHILSKLFKVLVVLLPGMVALGGEPLHYLATGNPPGSRNGDLEAVEFHEADTDDDGVIYAAGTHAGPMNFLGRGLGALTNSTNPRQRGIFLTRQAPNGTWEYLTEIYVPISVIPRDPQSQQDSFESRVTSAVISDIKVAGDYVYVTARLGPEPEHYGLRSFTQAGVLIKASKSNGAVVWSRFFFAADVTLNAVAVDSQGRVVVGGGFRSGSGPGTPNRPLRIVDPLQLTETARNLSTVHNQNTGTDRNYDAFLVQFSAAGAVNWTSRSGNTDKQKYQEFRAIEIDARNLIHVLMNAEGDLVNPDVNLNHSSLSNNARYSTVGIGCLYKSFGASCDGAKSTIFGRLDSNGSWVRSGWISPDDHLKAEVLSFNGDALAGPVTNVFRSTDALIIGTDLKSLNGKVYISAAYTITRPVVFVSFRVFPKKLETGGIILRLSDDLTVENKAVYFKPGGAQLPTYPYQLRAADDRLLVVGRCGSAVNLHSLDIASTSLGNPSKSFNGIVPSDFVVSFDADLAAQWITGTAQPGTKPAPAYFNGSLLAYSRAGSRILWGGGFRTIANALTNIPLVIGEVDELATLSTQNPTNSPTSWGWIVGLNKDGKHQIQNTLVVHSREGAVTVNGENFGGTGPYLRGSRLTLRVPAEISEKDGRTRHLSRGYNIDDEIVSGTGNTYSFELTGDLVLTINWLTQHRLTVVSDQAGAGIPAGATPGNPSPPIGDHWLDAGAAVNPSVTGIIDDPANLDARYYVRRIQVEDAATEVRAFPQPVASPAPTQFTMSGPAKVTYTWRKQYSVSINDNAPQGLRLERTRQLESGTDPEILVQGPGRLWFDAGSELELGTQAIIPGAEKSLIGWQAASPPGADYFPKQVFTASATGSEKLSDVLTARTEEDIPYWYRRIERLDRPVTVLWDYGNTLRPLHVAVGNAFAPADGALAKAPTAVRELVSVSGIGTTDAFVWDPKRARGVVVRPGIFELTWESATTGGPEIRNLLYTGFDGDTFQDDPSQRFINPVRYRHIAQTPPVVLDPSPSDARYFDGLLFHLGSAAVGADGFTATRQTKSVLLFRTNAVGSRVVRDPTEEEVEVRVVETRPWNVTNAWTGTSGMLMTNSGSAIIGSPLRDPNHSSTARAGYLVHEIANYNANLHDRPTATGPIIPVNNRIDTPSLASNRELIVVWYEVVDGIDWPYQPKWYRDFAWPTALATPEGLDGELRRIVIASRLGSEGLSTNGVVQPAFDPSRFSEVAIYNQPDANRPGYNPNEEHARLYNSMLAALDGKAIPAAFALRNDLNLSSAFITNSGGRFATHQFTSDPYVLVQYRDEESGKQRMAVYAVQREDHTVEDVRLDRLPGATGHSYRFYYSVVAGEPLKAPYPLDLVIGLFPCINTTPGIPFNPSANTPNGTYFTDGGAQRTWHVDHKGGTWIVSGDSTLDGFFSYRLQPDFHYPFTADQQSHPDAEGDCIPWLPKWEPNPVAGDPSLGVFDADNVIRNQPVPVHYVTRWPTNVAVLKVGETLTYPGGEAKADEPDRPGLPGVIAFAAGTVLFDSRTPDMAPRSPEDHSTHFTARLIAPLEERLISLPTTNLPESINPASQEVEVNGDEWSFTQLPPSLRRRVFFRPLARLNANDPTGVLGLRGFVNDRTLGASDLTASPPPLYILEPNVLTETNQIALRGILNSAGGTRAVDALYNLSRDPGSVGGSTWNVGLEKAEGQSNARPAALLGPGLALVTNPELLLPPDHTEPLYVTLAENDHPSLGAAPVSLHVIRVDRNRLFRGAIKTVSPPNVFDEKTTLVHTADFGGNVDRVAYNWWYHEEDGTVKVGDTPRTPKWNAFGPADGAAGLNQLDLHGDPTLLLADQLFYVRYRHTNNSTLNPPRGPRWSEWAGAANSSIRDLNNDGRPDLRPQLVMGWVKRVLDAINPYEARIREFSRTDSPATAASLMANLGAPYVGPVALNASKDVIENTGLIALYETVLQRARTLTGLDQGNTATPGALSAILLASTRLSYLYSLLGSEAWDDANDPTIGFGRVEIAVDLGNLNSSRFCFENQKATLLEEELALLRGNDENLGRPVFNRLFWNFTKGEGEVAYALNYQIKDVNQDGTLDELDALQLHPQGHGDAWGHYLSAIRKHYDLLTTPGFIWQRRSEYYNLLDVVIGADFFDERQFARTAVARAQVGAEIVNLTRRASYTESPAARTLGSSDPLPNHAWGVTEWGRRAGQAALIDWMIGNALLPEIDPDHTDAGIQRIDRSTVTELSEIGTHLGAIQLALDQSDAGLNPLGLDPNVVPFDIDPTHIDVGSTAQIGRQAVQGLSHFEQIFERAYEALRNASAALEQANLNKARLRDTGQKADSLRQQAAARDIEFRNRLIALFGTPYSGQIGTGKAYPAGYQWPDYNLFMYVDVNAVTSNTVPTANTAYLSEYVSFYALTNDIPARFRRDLSEHFLTNLSLEGNLAVEQLGGGVVHLRLPVTAENYSFVAPTSWGQRDSPGRLQALVGEMVQAQTDLSLAVIDYDYLIKVLRDKVALLKMRAAASDRVIGVKQLHSAIIKNLDEEIRELSRAAAILVTTADALSSYYEAGAEALPEEMGTSNDLTSVARALILINGIVVSTPLRALAINQEYALAGKEGLKTLIDLQTEMEIDELEMSVELRGMLYDIEEQLVNENVVRLRVFAQQERLRSLLDDYRATLQEGIRLIEERRQANAAIASETQENRYHDVLFRTSRHESIQRYRTLHDLAQRYCYIAAKAYDYETNFDPRDRAAARPILEEIIRSRALGTLGDNFPLAGPGLAGTMARLLDTFRSIEGRLGFNNFQYDQTAFSIRNEQARLASVEEGGTDQDWIDKLQASRVDDLWDVPEFRRFCRPFAPRGAPQPGLVLRFRTEVRAGRNFFGNPLGGGDASYDPTLYATKIRAAGVRMEGYPGAELARTPGVYLIPAGLDYMIIPNSPTLATRAWKVVDQAIPSPYQLGSTELGSANWIAGLDALTGAQGETRRFSSFRASVSPDPKDDNAFNSTRLIGRSVWNDQWILIIPGQVLHADPSEGLDRLIENITDITLHFETYGYSGN